MRSAGSPVAARRALIGRDIALPLLEQGPVTALPDGTRMHDQKIAAPGRSALDRLARRRDPRCRIGRERDPERRPRRHRPHRGRAGARAGARPGRGGEPRQGPLPRDGVARDPHAAERHPRAWRELLLDTPLHARTGDLRQGGEDLRRHAAVADRGDSRFLQDRGRQARSRGAARSRSALMVEEIVELLAPRAQAKGLEIASSIDERVGRPRGRRHGAAAPGAAQSRRQRGEIHRSRAASR